MKFLDKLKNIEVNYGGILEMALFIFIVVFFARFAIFLTDFIF